MKFRHISAKIQFKNPKLFHFYLLAVRGNISIALDNALACQVAAAEI